MKQDRVKRATELFENGYNCSQAIVGAFFDKFGTDEKMAIKMATALGGGVGGLRQTCGVITAMALVVGAEEGTSTPFDKDTKLANYQTVQKLAAKFKSEQGSLMCDELLGLVPGLPEDKAGRSCVEYVQYCATILDEYFAKQ